MVFRRADSGGGYEKGVLFRAAGPAPPSERHFQVDRDELLLLGGVAAVGVGLLVLLRGQPRCPSGYALVGGECKPITGPCPAHSHGPGEPYCTCLPGFQAAGAACQPVGGPAPATHCLVDGHGQLQRPSRFYNWSDLRVLPLNPRDPHNWYTGGTTTELGAAPGYFFAWTEAKVGTAGDGRTGWFLRIANPGNQPGDWALPADDMGAPHPCG